MERKHTGHARRQASNETQGETTNETTNETTTRKSKQYEAVIGGREEQTAPFSHLSPDPLSPALPYPSASIVPPPPPGVGRASGEARSPLSPSHPLPWRVPSLTPSPHPLSLSAYPYPRRHLSARTVFGSSFIRAAIAQPPQDARARRPPPPLIMASIKRPAHSTSRTRRKAGRSEWRAVPDRCLDRYLNRRCSRCPPSSHRISPARFPSRGGGNSRGGIYSAPFSSAHLIRLGSSSHPPNGSPFHQDGRTSKQQKEGKAVGQAGERLSLSAPSSYSCPRIALALVSPLVSADGAKGVSFPSAGSVGGPVSPFP